MARDPDAVILRRLQRSPASSTEIARVLRVSRQAAHRRLRRLAGEGAVAPVGAGRTARWRLPDAPRVELLLPTQGQQEDLVYAELERGAPALALMGPIARSIAFYAFTEMLNNAIDHAQSEDVTVALEVDGGGATFTVSDRGIGAFASIQRHEALSTPLEALQELSKGRVTTMPERHTGEGIFFTSKAVELFVLAANGVEWTVDNGRDDQAVRLLPPSAGTSVLFRVPSRPARALADVFGEYTEDLEFTKTRTTIRLFAIGVAFVSRSEARRLVHGLEKFREVVLDFGGVESVGQGFADEVFRVFARGNPGTRLVPIRMGEAVEFMVQRALRSAGRP